MRWLDGITDAMSMNLGKLRWGRAGLPRPRGGHGPADSKAGAQMRSRGFAGTSALVPPWPWAP